MFAKRIERLTSSLVRDILAAASRPGVISFAGGLPAEEALYRPDPAQLQSLQHCWQYGQTEGEPQLREAIAAEARALGIACDASQVLVLSGSQQGIDLVSKLFIEEGTRVLVEAPAYLAAVQSFRLFGADFLPVTVDPVTGPDAQSFKSALDSAQLAYLTPTFQNPSGYCYPAEQREHIAAAVDAAGVPLFEDDPYRELAFDGAAPQPIVGRLKNAPWVYQGSFSKTLAPGLRLGFLVAHPALVPHLTRLKQAADLHSNRLSQHLILQALQNGLHEHVAQILPVYRERRDAMADALTRHLGDLVSWQKPVGGLFFWVRFKQAVDTHALMRRALEAGVAIMPGDAFYTTTPEHSCLRLNFSHSSPAEIEEGMARLASLLR
ncbi:DNA-binding transcriptional MocR family regulator [Silvimonas terrae]|uniref:Putative 8-amino-7-oxononanoate synthase n=1 Tax=Silvimonas terrae TaxID=300266 RepID=A0A840RCC6_9NEIS|nr:PLP-dependent aminotransferase family protein [Silvimonas terrae]MBB5190224.1 DNA-binding transcriptional MocR family regulator [Silvimonas terrae]